MTDSEYMQLAIQLAESTKGQTSPNPVVGAVVVKNHQVVGMGAHLRAGEGHAEVHAMQMAGEKAKGATIYVTLEPCSHYGRTPPCSDLLIKSEVRRVVIATTDPNPLVAGKGIERLRNAGIEVELGILKKEADSLNEVFFHFIAKQIPYVTLKTAMSLDGKIATHTGDSKWITSETARHDVHQYRHQHDAILVGVNTVIKDNPSLTTRLPHGGGKNPIRIILDTNLRTPEQSRVIQDGQAETWIITGKNVTSARRDLLNHGHVKVFTMDRTNIEVKDLLIMLGKHNITSLFVEGGAAVNESFVKANAFQQIIAYIAPKLIGGKYAPTPIGGEGFAEIAETTNLSIESMSSIGSDIKIIAKPLRGD
ncbi:bifunctional diaminohydroxyphosphoribosylaminopyrimidine deaminase/5-amino-6-(5-phosphoribosylamino)uracil reductase RibD [Bacillus sp. HMF5848]|uniref:bifunctional diaminohydroxyphosphoribosylaminopyrimidine deaminase/5-amino-6-(5-phosphoribosylamino)uracil reductase RibD n=1 Tax=Bacillus sp. HMF5848 TaxID=2495421 RepID=UPI000F7A186D|nr:bifunctional diaminohydroxyphosphoribosylaminopyrimidine deaminase/5-amino-6-(5-phosphoribosylamino)uracil reductase RibD [Bacillus sp. HMF5848]RSK27510.1 bifunctional diaminohydroxyphosphoribosylaminopyrimidine deaminase/5-amino-6-(5-phosphoribosylamino)uracil reductase RibD [Bacillus sp. HMF5848]